MSTDTKTIGVSPELVADADAVIEAAMKRTPLDPEVYRRVHERAAEVTERIRRTQGIVNIAVDLIRESRDEA